MNPSKAYITLEKARTLVRAGFAVVPTNSNDEKRPLGYFSSAKSWREFSSRLPTDGELVGWFGSTPRRGGIVLHAGQLCIDHDTKDAMPSGDGGAAAAGAYPAPWEESEHGWHEFWSCPPETKIEHDHEGKIDFLTCGSFVRLCEPEKLIAWCGALPQYNGAASAINQFSNAIEEAKNPKIEKCAPNAPGAPTAPSLIALMESQGWRVSRQAANGWFSLVNGTKTAAISADGSTLKMFSTTMCEKPEVPEAPPPEAISVATLSERDPKLGDAVVNFCRRGSFALIAGDPKAGKTTLALKLCAKKALDGFRCLYADFENGPALFWHRLKKIFPSSDDGSVQGESVRSGLFYLDCRDTPQVAAIVSALDALGGIDLLVIDCWGLLIAGDGVEDESSNALVSQYFMSVRRALSPFNLATLILHHTPKSGANEKLCFAGAGASSLQRYVQTIARIEEDSSGAYWFKALCREFDEPFKPVLVRRAQAR